MASESLKRVDISRIVPDYERQFPMEMAILHLGGVYPGEKTEGFKNPYTGSVDNEYFGNVGEHCVAVAHCAEVIAKYVLVLHPPKFP